MSNSILFQTGRYTLQLDILKQDYIINMKKENIYIVMIRIMYLFSCEVLKFLYICLSKFKYINISKLI